MGSRFASRALCALLFASLSFAAYLALSLYTGNFSSEAVFSREGGESSPAELPGAHLQKLLLQPFRYVDRGHQTFALLGDDGHTVIKLFNFLRNDPPLWLRLIPPFPFVERYRERRVKGGNHRLQRMVDGYRTAWERGREDYGLSYIHLGVTEGFFRQPLLAYDRLGQEHRIDLDRALFVLQERAEIARALFSSLLSRGDVEGVKRRLDQVAALYLAERGAGIYDRDCNFLDNVGFIGERAIRIDVGRLREGGDDKEVERLTKRFKSWLANHFPDFSEELASYLCDHF